MNRAWLRDSIRTLSVCALAGTVGCGSDTAAAGYAVRDSAGIRVVENGAADAPGLAEWRIAAAPTVDVGVLEGAPEYQLFRVSGAERLSDGRLVVANTGTQELRFYDAQGRYLKSVGREGDGPGEFRMGFGLMRLRGDTLAVFDWSLRRISWFAPDGVFVRSAAVAERDAGTFPIVRGAFADGSFFALAGPVFRPGEVPKGSFQRDTRYFRVGPEGAVADTLGSFPGPEEYNGQEGGGFFVTSLPLGAAPAYAVAGERFWFGDGRHARVGTYDETGRLRALVRWQQAARPVTSRDVEAEKARRLEGSQDPNWQRIVESMFADMP
ncbi:MAG: hypothetical protein P8174_04235, partial [Gemmatimonadota bacterium]